MRIWLRQEEQMHQERRDLWKKRVDRWVASDLTAKEFAGEIGVNYQTLQYWKSKLKKEARGASASGGAQQQPRAPRRSRKEKSPRPVAFVELPSRQVTSTQLVEIQLRSGTLLRIPPDLDSGHLGKLLDVLDARS